MSTSSSTTDDANHLLGEVGMEKEDSCNISGITTMTNDGTPVVGFSPTTTSLSLTRKLNIDEVLELVGEYGTYQRILNVIFGLMEIPYVFIVYIMFFTALPPNWRCVSNSTQCTLNGTFANDDEYRCNIPRSEWEYVQPNSFSMIVAYDLGCDREWLVYLSTSIIFFGALFGFIILNWISDNYGRKKVVFVSYLFSNLANVLSAFMPSVELFIVFRFVAGFFMVGANCFIMISEVVGGKYRAPAGNIIWLFYTAALCLLSFKAYLIDSWKMLFFYGSIPYLVMMFVYKFVPESVRWLRLKGRVNDALVIIQNIGKVNGKILDVNVTLSVPPVKKTVTSPLDIFHSKKMILNTIILFFAFLVNANVYFGLSLAADDLGVGSVYLNFVLVSLVEFPADLLAIVFCNKFGRKKASTLPLILAGVLTLVVSSIPPTSTSRIVVGMFGKLFITISFNSISTWVVEIYTTNIRSEALGLMGISSTIGGASAPWIAKGLRKVKPNLPFHIMGTLGLVAGIVSFVLPETNGVVMKDNVIEAHEEVEDGIRLK